MLFILGVILWFETLLIYKWHRDVLNPAFVFSLVFFLAALNLISNIIYLDIEIHLVTVLFITFGVFAFFVGTLITNKVNVCFKLNLFGTRKRRIHTTNKILLLVLAFNFFAIAYITGEVYYLAQQYGDYQGNILGSLSRFAEVSKFGNMGLRIGMISTFLSAVAEAEAFVTGYIIVKNMVDKKRISLLMYCCFFTSFLSTFCQGSRGGVFIIISLIVVWILLYRRQRRLSFKLLKGILCIAILAIAVFQIAGDVVGKTWNVPAYEYFSVYLGFPIYNLDVVLLEGIPEASPVGVASFSGLYRKVFSMLGMDYYPYDYLKDFLNLEGHNTGNVYTIFGYLIADFGYVGSMIALVIIGALMQSFFNSVKKTRHNTSINTIVYGYLLSCIAFSFFSNKICENITVYHLGVLVFGFVWLNLFTRRVAYAHEPINI